MNKVSLSGLTVIHNFVTPSEADALIKDLDNALWLTDLKRRVQPCFNGIILSLSLGGACVMTFDSLPSAPSHEAHHSLWLQPADLLIMTGEARYQWKHGIPARKSDEIDGVRITRARRVSLTFRTVLRT